MKLTKPRVLLSLTAAVTLGLAYALTNGVGNLGATAHASVTELTAQNIQSVLTDVKKPILIEFYSDKSADSKAELVVLDAAANDLAGQVDVYRVDTDKEQKLTAALKDVVSRLVGKKLPSLPPTALVMLKFDASGNPQLMNAGAGLMPEQSVVQFAVDGLTGKALQTPAASTDKAPAAPTDKAPAAPTDKAPAAPTDQTPAAPTDQAPAAPTDQAPAAPTDKAPAAPTDKAPAASTDKTPAAPAQSLPPRSVPLHPDAGATNDGAPNATPLQGGQKP